jgi:hypothetical protein
MRFPKDRKGLEPSGFAFDVQLRYGFFMAFGATREREVAQRT